MTKQGSKWLQIWITFFHFRSKFSKKAIRQVFIRCKRMKFGSVLLSNAVGGYCIRPLFFFILGRFQYAPTSEPFFRVFVWCFTLKKTRHLEYFQIPRI